jgi:hypothetical protein
MTTATENPWKDIEVHYHSQNNRISGSELIFDYEERGKERKIELDRLSCLQQVPV